MTRDMNRAFKSLLDVTRKDVEALGFDPDISNEKMQRIARKVGDAVISYWWDALREALIFEGYGQTHASDLEE